VTARRTCVVADDHPALLRAAVDVLTSGALDVVAAVGDGPAAVAAAESAQPDVAVLDFRMPGLAGGELVRAVRERCPRTAVVVYTAGDDEELVRTAVHAGATGVVLKDAPLSDLLRAVDAVLDGSVYVDPGLATALRPERRETTQAALTARELDVLSLLGDGLTHDAIGERLQLSTDTVRTHVRKAAARLGARNRTHAVALAIRRGQL